MDDEGREMVLRCVQALRAAGLTGSEAVRVCRAAAVLPGPMDVEVLRALNGLATFAEREARDLRRAAEFLRGSGGVPS